MITKRRLLSWTPVVAYLMKRENFDCHRLDYLRQIKNNTITLSIIHLGLFTIKRLGIAIILTDSNEACITFPVIEGGVSQFFGEYSGKNVNNPRPCKCETASAVFCTLLNKGSMLSFDTFSVLQWFHRGIKIKTFRDQKLVLSPIKNPGFANWKD